MVTIQLRMTLFFFKDKKISVNEIKKVTVSQGFVYSYNGVYALFVPFEIEEKISIIMNETKD